MEEKLARVRRFDVPACSHMRSRVVQMYVGPWRGVELKSDTSESAASRREAATDDGLGEPVRGSKMLAPSQVNTTADLIPGSAAEL